MKLLYRYHFTMKLFRGLWKKINAVFSSYAEFSEIKMLIKDNTIISRNHMTPEIALHLITSSCPLWKARPENCPFPDPYWAFYWPGGQAVTRFILDNPELVKGASIIDVGSGCGASAIAASMCGAKVAIANDIDPVAGIAAEMNASLNNVKITVSLDNHIDDSMNSFDRENLPWDVIVLGDLFYDDYMCKRVMAWAKLCSSLGALILIGDPERYSFTKEIGNLRCSSSGDNTSSNIVPRLQLLKSYSLSRESCLENNGLSHASVWKIDASNNFPHIT